MTTINDVIAILRELGPIITAATPVLLVVVTWWTKRANDKAIKDQTTVINDHSTQTTNAVRNELASATGTHRVLPE